MIHFIYVLFGFLAGGIAGIAILALCMSAKDEVPQPTVSEIGRRIG